MTEVNDLWILQACALPSVDRPLRLQEVKGMLVSALRGVSRISPTMLRWSLDSGAERAARELMAREIECCSFFTFHIFVAGDVLVVDVEVPAAQTPVLDALAALAAASLAKR